MSLPRHILIMLLKKLLQKRGCRGFKAGSFFRIFKKLKDFFHKSRPKFGVTQGFFPKTQGFFIIFCKKKTLGN